jgi:hypothetical protein
MEEPLSSSEIKNLKDIFGSIHKINIGGIDYIFRTINRKDAANIKIFEEDTISLEKEEEVLRIALIQPASINYEEIDAGTVSSIVSAILDKSGLSSIDSLATALENARNRKTIFTEIYEIICLGFPSILPGDLETLPINSLMDLFVMAESMLIKQGILEDEIYFDSDDVKASPKRDYTAAMLENALDEAQSKGYL